jgi:hypothetical protein
MPKFITYQRPAPVNKQNWNGAPKQQSPLPRKAPIEAKPAVALPGLDTLLKR